MKNLVIGILAHVDAGKTTLSESMLYLSGKIRQLGRVDHKDAYLDTNTIEKERGITIFSKQARFTLQDTGITLVDTPGHVDFSAEMERTLQVLDYAILVISGAAGVQGHTKTLWRLLSLYEVPTFVFINKMDQPGTCQESLMKALKKQLSDGCIDFTDTTSEAFCEQVALSDEMLMNHYLETGELTEDHVVASIQKRQVFPCYFGSALKLEGVESLLQALVQYTARPTYPADFGAKVFKIGRDEQGNRLTYLKVTGGALQVKQLIAQAEWEEKVNQLRLYSGVKYEAVQTVQAGEVCAVLGLTRTYPGEGLGGEKSSHAPILEPVLFYKLLLPTGVDPRVLMPKLQEIEEEEPELHIVWEETSQEIHVQMMGEVQIEVLQQRIAERFGVHVAFGHGTILYKETITAAVEGVGHFEPLRHYAEVHIVLEPLPRGSGLVFDTRCSEDVLDKNWQRLVLSHLKEKAHKGVLTGSAITDIKLTLVSGRAHNKHTEGGDFREATYRAIRQGLMQAPSVLLEPYYQFTLQVPANMVGRAMTDIERLQGSSTLSETDDNSATLVGTGPVARLRNYQKEVIAYTKGEGRFDATLAGYAPCHNTQDILDTMDYDPERDVFNPTGSVFCAHGTGFIVPWDEVEQYMHIEKTLATKKTKVAEQTIQVDTFREAPSIGQDEIERIMQQTYYKNQGEKSVWRKRQGFQETAMRQVPTRRPSYASKQEAYLLVDGYNIIFAWEDLCDIAQSNMDGARIKLLETLSNYQGIKQCKIIVVFDAYRVPGGRAAVEAYQNIHLVFTKEAQTADHYIEQFVHKHHADYQVTVATSDGLEQIIIRGQGCLLLSARDLKEEVTRANDTMMQQYREQQIQDKHYLSDVMHPSLKEEMQALIQDRN